MREADDGGCLRVFGRDEPASRCAPAWRFVADETDRVKLPFTSQKEINDILTFNSSAIVSELTLAWSCLFDGRLTSPGLRQSGEEQGLFQEI